MVGKKFTNITTQATTNVFEGRGTLISILINKPLADGSVVVYNNTAGSGAKVGTILKPATLLSDNVDNIGYGENGIALSLGCTIVTSGANQDITVVWEQP